MDVDVAHRVTLEHLDDENGLRTLNIGTGTGVSGLQLLATFQEACGVTVPYEIAGRRPGDAPSAIADSSRAGKEWGWRTRRDLRAMCADAWRFRSLHPQRYSASLFFSFQYCMVKE